MALDALGSGNSGFGEGTKDYNPKLLETFDNKHQKNCYWVQLVCSEFTTLCPKTGQPDIAVLYINYVPAQKMVESKSLKLYLSSFRNHGDFHEDVCNIIANDLNDLLTPHYLEIMGRFNPRGGIAIYPYVWRSRGLLGDDLRDKRRAEFPVIPQREPVLH